LIRVGKYYSDASEVLNTNALGPTPPKIIYIVNCSISHHNAMYIISYIMNLRCNCSIFGLPASAESTGLQASWHALNKAFYETAWYATPTLLEGFAKAIPLFLRYAAIIILWIELVHASF
jgi:hypothetical protein